GPCIPSSRRHPRDLLARAGLLHDGDRLAAALEIPGVDVVLADALDLHGEVGDRITGRAVHLVGHAAQGLRVQDEARRGHRQVRRDDHLQACDLLDLAGVDRVVGRLPAPQVRDDRVDHHRHVAEVRHDERVRVVAEVAGADDPLGVENVVEDLRRARVPLAERRRVGERRADRRHGDRVDLRDDRVDHLLHGPVDGRLAVHVAGDLLVGDPDLLAPLRDRREGGGAGRHVRERVLRPGRNRLDGAVGDEGLGLLVQHGTAAGAEPLREQLVGDEPQVLEVAQASLDRLRRVEEPADGQGISREDGSPGRVGARHGLSPLGGYRRPWKRTLAGAVAPVTAVPIRVPAAEPAAIEVATGSTWPDAADWMPPPAEMLLAETISWMTPSSGQTDTLAPDAASWAKTPATIVDAAPAVATVPEPDQTARVPPVTAPEVVDVHGTAPPVTTGV